MASVVSWTRVNTPVKRRQQSQESRRSKVFVHCSATARVQFAKYHGLGNDFVLVDSRKGEEPMINAEQAKKVCDRSFGVGADGVILATPPFGSSAKEDTYGMRIFNADGSEAEMCGNGIRCLARFIGYTGSTSVSTLAGKMTPNVLPDGRVAVDMGEPVLDPGSIPCALAPKAGSETVVRTQLTDEHKASNSWLATAVGMGNPHAVIFAHADGSPIANVDALELETIGPPLETHSAFPSRANIEFVQLLDDGSLKMRVWERGAGQTLACGTGACAVAVAAVLEGRADRHSIVHLPGGPLEIEWHSNTNRVTMTGPAEAVFTGTLSDGFLEE